MLDGGGCTQRCWGFSSGGETWIVEEAGFVLVEPAWKMGYLEHQDSQLTDNSLLIIGGLWSLKSDIVSLSQQNILPSPTLLFRMDYNPRSTAISRTTLHSDSLLPLSTFLAHSKRRRDSHALRLANPTFNPEDLALKDRLLKEQLDSMESAIALDKADLDRTIFKNTEEQRIVSESSKIQRAEAEGRWARENNSCYHRSMSLIDSVQPIERLTSFLGYSRRQPLISPWDYESARVKQLQRLRAVQRLQAEYARQEALSRITFDRPY